MNMEARFAIGNIEVLGLPPRQAETLAHTVLGLSSKQTAKVMHISPRTVEMNLNLAMARFGAANRVHLVACAIAAGALRVRAAAAAVSVCSMLALASIPTPQHQPDDMARNSRSVRVRVRRNREDLFAYNLLEELA